MPIHKEKINENCECRDPFRPDQKLYDCGSETCKFLKIFYEQYIRAHRPPPDEED